MITIQSHKNTAGAEPLPQAVESEGGNMKAHIIISKVKQCRGALSDIFGGEDMCRLISELFYLNNIFLDSFESCAFFMFTAHSLFWEAKEKTTSIKDTKKCKSGLLCPGKPQQHHSP